MTAQANYIYRCTDMPNRYEIVGAFTVTEDAGVHRLNLYVESQDAGLVERLPQLFSEFEWWFRPGAVSPELGIDSRNLFLLEQMSRPSVVDQPAASEKCVSCGIEVRNPRQVNMYLLQYPELWEWVLATKAMIDQTRPTAVRVVLSMSSHELQIAVADHWSVEEANQWIEDFDERYFLPLPDEVRRRLIVTTKFVPVWGA